MKTIKTNSSKKLKHDEDGGYWMSIGDLMAGLMFIFILALSLFMLNFSKITDELTQIDRTREEILFDIKVEMEKKGFTQIIIVQNEGILRLQQGVLFNTAEAILLEEGRELLEVLGSVIYDVLTREQYDRKVETIFIEGHTDSLSINTPEFPSNWHLSVRRAINTWNFMRESESNLENLINQNEQPVFSTSGYAETRPVATNMTDEGRSQNRRIDFRFNMLPPKSSGSPIIKSIEATLNVK